MKCNLKLAHQPQGTLPAVRGLDQRSYQHSQSCGSEQVVQPAVDVYNAARAYGVGSFGTLERRPILR